MQSIEASNYEIRSSEENEYLILMPFVNDKEYFEDLESVKFVIEDNILNIGYYKNSELKRRLTFSDLPLRTLLGMKNQQTIVVCEFFKDSEIFYDVHNFDLLDEE